MYVSTSNGYTFRVDKEDVSLAKENGWCGCIHRHRRISGEYGNEFKYIIRHTYFNGKRQNQYFHRLIINAPSDAKVDHKNGDTLDNRKSNLRVCTIAENVRNSVRMNRNTSGYKGVSYSKRSRKWKTTITVNNQHKHLGYFLTPEAAAMAYNIAAEKHFGEFAKYNMIFEKYNEPEESFCDSNRSISNG